MLKSLLHDAARGCEAYCGYWFTLPHCGVILRVFLFNNVSALMLLEFCAAISSLQFRVFVTLQRPLVSSSNRILKQRKRRNLNLSHVASAQAACAAKNAGTSTRLLEQSR